MLASRFRSQCPPYSVSKLFLEHPPYLYTDACRERTVLCLAPSRDTPSTAPTSASFPRLQPHDGHTTVSDTPDMMLPCPGPGGLLHVATLFSPGHYCLFCFFGDVWGACWGRGALASYAKRASFGVMFQVGRPPADGTLHHGAWID